jgi:hypothetical protein
MTEPVPPAPSKRKLLIGGAVAVVAAAAIVVCAVLPAEYGIDPTGVGKALGLTKIAAPVSQELERGKKRTGVLTLSGTPLAPLPGAADHYEIVLPPYQSIEMKYVIAQGDAIVFDWRATAPVHVDMHAHPFDGGTALTESYTIEDAVAGQSGRYVAPFTGIHGWYWQNRSIGDVTVTVDASGAMTGSKTFDSSGEHDRALTPPAAAETPAAE